MLCALGIDIRALVGGESHGWLARTPCVTGALTNSERQMSCQDRQLPTDEQIAAWEAETSRVIAEYLEEHTTG